jgi:hypothetical protein
MQIIESLKKEKSIRKIFRKKNGLDRINSGTIRTLGIHIYIYIELGRVLIASGL